MTTLDLQAQFNTAAAERERRDAELAGIRGKITDAKRRLADAERDRQVHAHGAATGDAKSAAAMTKARREYQSAGLDLEDWQAALPQAEKLFSEAQLRELEARRALTRLNARKRQQDRVKAGRAYDEAWGPLLHALEEYDRHGEAVEEAFMSDMASRGYANVTATVSLTGLQRVMAAIPPEFVKRLQRFCPQFVPPSLSVDHHVRYVPLEDSERDFFNLPKGQEDEQT